MEVLNFDLKFLCRVHVTVVHWQASQTGSEKKRLSAAFWKTTSIQLQQPETAASAYEENSLSPHFFPSVWRQEDRLTATLYHRRGKVGLVEPTHARKHGLSEGSQGDQWARFKTAAAAFYTRAGTRGERKKNPSNNFHPRSRESSLTADAAAMMGCQPHCSWTSLHVTTSCSWGCRIFISSACLKFFLFFVCFRPA